MEELIKRLRAMARYEHDDLGMGNEAADALEAQQARIALLTCERDELRQFHDASMVELAKLVGADVADEPRFKWVHLEISNRLMAQQARIAELEGEQGPVDVHVSRFPACKGTNCGCTDGRSHSQECVTEHDAATALPYDEKWLHHPDTGRGWKCYVCNYSGTENNCANMFCANCHCHR